jgi:glutamine synthetase
MSSDPSQKQELPARLRELQTQGVTSVRVVYADIHGIARGKDTPLSQFAQVVEHGMGFCAAGLTSGLALSLASLPTRPAEPTYPDMRVLPVPDTLARLPWEPGIAWCTSRLDAADEHGAKSPRSILERAVAAYRGLGLTPITAAELEFYLVKRDEQGRLTAAESESCMVYTLGDRSDPSGLVREMLRYGNEIGLDVTTAHHECGRGQYEINLNHGEALHSADRAFLFKYMVKELAARRDLLATFMGKPFVNDAGSGFHLHVSLEDERGNRFFDAASPDGLSALARHFLAGVLEHAPALAAFCCPTINSYKRLVPGTLVPVVANWGWDNRTTYIRVAEKNDKSTRVELRAADAAANPYLVTAANLFAGLDGVKRRLDPPPPVFDDRIIGRSLPTRLEESLQALCEDAYMVEMVGKPLVDAFCAIKSMEAERYGQHVSAWELNEYAWHL